MLIRRSLLLRPVLRRISTGTTAKSDNRMIYKALSALVVSGAGLYAYLEYTKQHRPTQQTSIGKPLIGGPFSLVDFNGIPVTDLTYRGKYMLLYFGYTFCPDVCPEELEKMARIVDTVEAAKGDAIVPIFISVDPKRDSLKAIKEYCAEFSSKFIGLTGTYNQIKSVAKAYRMYFSAPPRAIDDDESDYLVDHSIFFYLMGPDGQYISHFGNQESDKSVSAKILEIMNKNKNK